MKHAKVSTKSKSDLLTVAEVAHMLRVDDTTVRRWVKQGALDAIVLPHTNLRQVYRIRRETLEEVMGSEPEEVMESESESEEVMESEQTA